MIKKMMAVICLSSLAAAAAVAAVSPEEAARLGQDLTPVGAEMAGNAKKNATGASLVGQRRVRLAPAVSFDTPNPAVAGTSTYDDAFIFNGSPERFDWTLLGKKEIIIPASNWDFLFQVKVEDILGPKFLNPEKVRWEKKRAWIVEGNLKEGSRHLYSKRRFYIDEDSWTAHAGEMYLGRGNLWRVQYT